MKTITLPESAVPFGAYAHKVATRGHRPGVLRGRDLKGHRDGLVWYARERARVRACLHPHGIVHCDDRDVWVDSRTGELVRVVLA